MHHRAGIVSEKAYNIRCSGVLNCCINLLRLMEISVPSLHSTDSLICARYPVFNFVIYYQESLQPVNTATCICTVLVVWK